MAKLSANTSEVLKMLSEQTGRDIDIIINGALVALAQRDLIHFCRTDGGHYFLGPKLALKAISKLRPWTMNPSGDSITR